MGHKDRSPLLSVEGAISIFFGLVAALANLGWELRTLLVAFAALLAVHIGRRINTGALKRLSLVVAGVSGLIVVTWRPIWESFHKDFPDVTGETVLFRIIIAAVISAIGMMGYWFFIRSRSRGLGLIPAQLIAFGVWVIGFGLVAAAIGVIWQFRQNQSLGITPYIVPGRLSSTDQPQITQTPRALPTPNSPEASNQPQSPQLTNGYGLTPAGIRVLADEAFKIKETLPSVIVFRLAMDGTANSLANQIVTGLERGGIQSSISVGRLAGPNEIGVMIIFDDPEKLPEPAAKLKQALERSGLGVTLVKRPVGSFQLFVGPNPEN